VDKLPTSSLLTEEMKLQKDAASPDLADGIETLQIFDRTNLLARMMDDEELAKAVSLLEEIEPREAQVLSLRFGLNGKEPLTLKEIGVELDLTRERVRQIQRNGLARLNELMTS